ncbi:hypothetical protein ABTY61_00135 [Kitasatospora sp. NPDC096128]|uniref:hypothetical protein n=1 Tax=Kitasatospora sp. NPDC096128 TaxID=3155547 RepID=UPI003323E99E
MTGLDAYLTAVEAGSSTAPGLRERALELWADLERIAFFPPPEIDRAVTAPASAEIHHLA